MAAIKVNKSEFDSIVRKSDKVVLVDFYADWCGPCRMFLPIVEEFASERDDVLVVKVNVDSEPELAREFGVFSIPTIAIIKDGEVVHKSAGAKPKSALAGLLAPHI